MKIGLTTRSKKLLADTLTPVTIYLRLRDVFAGSILLESSDYHGHENSLSIICCDPIASFQVAGETIAIAYPGKSETLLPIREGTDVVRALDSFRTAFAAGASTAKYPVTGLFGYTAYDAVRYFEDVQISIRDTAIPDMVYQLYRYVIVVDHFSNSLVISETGTGGQTSGDGLERIERIIYSNRMGVYPFAYGRDETSYMDDDSYMDMVRRGIAHCRRGDVFQIVLSRRFSGSFKGDEFNVYRALRSINPSPYLFFFDFGGFKIFGSSPESQLRISGNYASLFPIAGTFRRTGNDAEDAALAVRLAQDAKENAEHVMLVDLARNDLSRHCRNVKVEVFREVQYYSHVIHLVSKVTGQLEPGVSPVTLAADTFPAGTLSGAPKPMAIKLINDYEPVGRGFYGGAIGYLGFDGSYNHAIMIRTFLSQGNRLIRQAGAGIVAKSDPQSELQEVSNKLEALKKAIEMAEKMYDRL
jgi:anthranilate synthase component 1